MSEFVKSIAETAAAVIGVRLSETPAHEVIDRFADVEVRRYGPRLTAETVVSGQDDEAMRSEAFSLLAGYIFGKNRARVSISMTTPVEIAPIEDTGERIAMTAPVETIADARGQLRMRFFLPSRISAASAPEPLDPRVRIVLAEGETLAMTRFSGSWSAEGFAQKMADLTRAVERSSWRAAGAPFTLFYDPPFTPPPLRRNEVAVRVVSRAAN